MKDEFENNIIKGKNWNILCYTIRESIILIARIECFVYYLNYITTKIQIIEKTSVYYYTYYF